MTLRRFACCVQDEIVHFLSKRPMQLGATATLKHVDPGGGSLGLLPEPHGQKNAPFVAKPLVFFGWEFPHWDHAIGVFHIRLMGL